MWKQIVGQTQTYAATSNRQTQYGSTLLLQDAAGNLTAYGSKLFSYDSANRMSMAVTGSTTTTYRYNGLGQRTTKLATTSGNTVVTHYDYDKDGKYLGQVQLNPDGTYAQGDDYIWLDDMPIAQIHTTYGVNNAIASQQLTYIHADHLNTPRAMTDSTKKIVWKWESEAYGRTAPNTDPDGDTVLNRLDLRFPGQIADAETGFYYNVNRYYDPMMGRYTQSDPIGLMGGLNTYAYANDNPIRFIDPLGLAACTGYWERINWTPAPLGFGPIRKCICNWICLSCEGPELQPQSGDPNFISSNEEHRTKGMVFFNGHIGGASHDPEVGNDCSCQKPGPENKCPCRKGK